MVSGFYKMNSNNEVDLFAPLWPYQICEQALEGNSPDWAITNQPIGNRAGLWDQNGATPAEMKEQYSKYIMECALPRMCSLADGRLAFTSTRKKISTNGSDTITYTADYTETAVKPQAYLAFFNNGRVNSTGIPYYDECSININRIFRISDIDILDTNINTHYYRINNDDGIADDMNAQIDADQEAIGLDEEEDDYSGIKVRRFRYMETNTAMVAGVYVRFASSNKYTRGDNTIHILGHSLLRHTDSAAESSNTHSWVPGGGHIVPPVPNVENNEEVEAWEKKTNYAMYEM
jgi:hypothetical protein